MPVSFKLSFILPSNLQLGLWLGPWKYFREKKIKSRFLSFVFVGGGGEWGEIIGRAVTFVYTEFSSKHISFILGYRILFQRNQPSQNIFCPTGGTHQNIKKSVFFFMSVIHLFREISYAYNAVNSVLDFFFLRIRLFSLSLLLGQPGTLRLRGLPWCLLYFRSSNSGMTTYARDF